MTKICSLNIIKTIEATSSFLRIHKGDKTWKKQLGNPKCGTYIRTSLDSAKVNFLRGKKVTIVLKLKKHKSNAQNLIKSVWRWEKV